MAPGLPIRVEGLGSELPKFPLRADMRLNKHVIRNTQQPEAAWKGKEIRKQNYQEHL